MLDKNVVRDIGQHTNNVRASCIDDREAEGIILKRWLYKHSTVAVGTVLLYII